LVLTPYPSPYWRGEQEERGEKGKKRKKSVIICVLK
jgi:hypothetical protein